MTFSALRAASGSINAGIPPVQQDPTFSNVVILAMNGNGTEGNQDMTDQSNTPHTFTWAGNAQMDTGIEKFSGVPTLLLDGTDDWLSAPDNDDFAFGSGNFTIESWVYPTSFTGSPAIVTQYRASGDDREWYVRLGSAGFPQFSSTQNGVTFMSPTVLSTTAISTSVWSYIVVQREDDFFALWVNGIRTFGPTEYVGWTIHNGGGPQFRIGARDTTSTKWEFPGNLGPMRITKGEAVYPGNPGQIFVPTTTFPTS